jgi:hypothetical protein
VSALDELRVDGRLGNAGARMLYASVRAVGKGRGFKPPVGHDRWSKDAIAEVAHDFLADSRTPGRLAHLTIHATDDKSMERLLNTMVLNYLRDQGRRTEVGRLVRRINTLLTKDERFLSAHDRWSLNPGPTTPSTTPLEELARAADAVEHVTVPRWSDRTARAHPHADAPSIARLCHTVLEAAEGSLTPADLARAIAARVGLRPTPIVNLLDVPEPADHTYTTVLEASDDRIAARALFDTLTEREKRIMATLHLPLRDLFDAIGIKKSQASPVRARTIAAVTEATSDLPNPDVVRAHIHDLARGWLQDRTTDADAAS